MWQRAGRDSALQSERVRVRVGVRATVRVIVRVKVRVRVRVRARARLCVPLPRRLVQEHLCSVCLEGLGVVYRMAPSWMQGYLAYKGKPPPRTLR